MRAVKCVACFDLQLPVLEASIWQQDAAQSRSHFDWASSGITKVIGFFLCFFVALQHPFDPFQRFSYPVL